MLEQPQSPSTSHTKQHLFDHYLHRLQSEIHTILAGESEYEERVKHLENDLSAFKRAHHSSDSELKSLTQENIALREKLAAYESAIKTPIVTGRRLVCLIDADKMPFAGHLLAQGHRGGFRAAQILSDSIDYHIAHSPCRLWVTVLFSNDVLASWFVKAGIAAGTKPEEKDAEVRERMAEFVCGFNEFCETFVMADVGNGEGAVECRIAALSDDNVNAPHVHQVLIGDCDETGYIANAEPFIDNDYCDKVILLSGYHELRYQYQNMASLVIPGLFVSEESDSQGRVNVGSDSSEQDGQGQELEDDHEHEHDQGDDDHPQEERDVHEHDHEIGIPPGLSRSHSKSPSTDGGVKTPLSPTPHPDEDASVSGSSSSASPSMSSSQISSASSSSSSTASSSAGKVPAQIQTPTAGPSLVDRSNGNNSSTGSQTLPLAAQGQTPAQAQAPPQQQQQQPLIQAPQATLPLKPPSYRTVLQTHNTNHASSGSGSGSPGSSHSHPHSHSHSQSHPHAQSHSHMHSHSHSVSHPTTFARPTPVVAKGPLTVGGGRDRGMSLSGIGLVGGGAKVRRINKALPLNQHDPPPCTLFYLAAYGCKHGAECRFGHDYVLEEDDYELLKANAKKVPCPTVNRGEVCVFGENCCYGHTCPFSTRCHYFKQGGCKFAGPSMHRDV